jgi:hypothetical protein
MTWEEIFMAIGKLILIYFGWRFVTNAGPGPSLRVVWEQNRTLGSTTRVN